MIKFLKNWVVITRAYALPMTIFSWFAAFAYSLTREGNFVYGILSLLGVCIVHLGANMFDDFIDYHMLPKKYDEQNKLILLNAQQNKCSYITDSIITINQLLLVSIIFFVLALCIGIYLACQTGLGVYIFMFLAGILGVLYPLLGKFRLCELAIALIYGPLLFGGVNYVMTGSYDLNTLVVCIPTMLFTVNLLYTDTMLDYDIDIKEKKKTIANLFRNRFDSYKFHKILLILSYLSVLLVEIFDITDWEILFTWVTFPMAVNLLKSMKQYVDCPSNSAEEFMLRMYQARNLMICFSLIFGVILLLSEG